MARTGVNRFVARALLGLAVITLASCEEPRPEVTVDAGDPGPQASATALYATPDPATPGP